MLKLGQIALLVQGMIKWPTLIDDNGITVRHGRRKEIFVPLTRILSIEDVAFRPEQKDSQTFRATVLAQPNVAIRTVGLLVSPWLALGVLVRQKEALAREQEMAFRLARGELERREQDARLHLMQAQVAPHFLSNTLANVQALVDARSPKAPNLLRALTTYLRSAVPRLGREAHTLGSELNSVQAYLELMHMRMPDRLQFSVEIDPATRQLRCPPLAVMTLVENAVKHGIDPCETGGRIHVRSELSGSRCLIQVIDTGRGLSAHSAGTGTGLSTLRGRLQLAFGPEAALRLSDNDPHGFRAEIELPAERLG